MRSSTPSSSRTFLAKLHPLAARFNLKPHLSDVTLANVLAGDTCAPISLSDFERHLTYVEYSIENLQFLVWFQDYRERYLKVAPGQASPISENFTFKAPSHAQAERHAEETLSKLNDPPRIHVEDISLPASPTDAVSPTSLSPMLPPQYTQLALPQLAYTIAKNNDSENDGFRIECSRVVATFLSPGAAKELPLDAIIRDTAIRNLSLDCHPDVFMPVYEEIYNLVERFSLPHFLSAASANINLPKQMYWYIVGLCNMIVGLVSAFLLIMLLPTPPNANRAWRLFSVGFFGVGAAQCYSAWRGYCTQVWFRGNTQLRVWEMQEMDTEAKAFVSRVLAPQEGRQQRQQQQQRHFAEEGREQAPPSSSVSSFHELEEEDKAGQSKQDTNDANVAVIAPFTIEPRIMATKRRSSSPFTGEATRPSMSSSRRGGAAASFMHHFQRPPIFGPETVVLEPRIKALHRQLVIEVFRFGLWVMAALSALVFAVPSRRHS